jgi:hypothetical protein
MKDVTIILCKNRVSLNLFLILQVSNSSHTAWRWGECAPSHPISEMLNTQGDEYPHVLQEEVKNTQDQGEGGMGSENVDVIEEGLQHAPNMVCSIPQTVSNRALTVCSVQQEFVPISAASILRGEVTRLRRIHAQVQWIYESEIQLSQIVDSLIEELDSEEVDVIMQ